jgi:hypothetical protein
MWNKNLAPRSLGEEEFTAELNVNVCMVKKKCTQVPVLT